MGGRQRVVERGLVPAAVAALTAHAFTALPFESLGPTKALLKRFFSAAPWGHAEDAALADAVGPGQGWWSEQLDDDLVMEFGWKDGRFTLRVEGGTDVDEPATPGPADALAATFERSVVPEATPNPRTLAFRTGRVHEGESRSYRSLAEADDPRVARLFRSFPELATVLVAQDFVALTLRRAEAWEALLVPVLDAGELLGHGVE
ncbi:MAG TPA: NifU N-terminal domain-containing protein, partial [Acidimicrobiales bacterium]|nr:NifU N-terminal domain-containing protein [Acidimicrobiales bacterium]